MSEKKKQNIIYHYCSLEAFYSIITNKSFWLFSLSSSYDLKELTEAETIIDKILTEEKYKSIEKPDEFYSLSCTSRRDSASHFNKYADNDKGVCFGIDINAFKKYFKNTSLMHPYFGYLFFPEVIYDDNQKEKEIKRYLEERLSYIEQPDKVDAKEFHEILIAASPKQYKDALKKLTYTNTLSRFKPKLKIENYKDESETRILFCRSQFQLYKNLFKANPYLYDAQVKPAEKLNLDKEPKFKVVSGVIRKYIELNMKLIWNERPIKEVILGPNCKTEIKEFNEFLKLYDVGCESENSKIKTRK